ncbi:MAG: hypothetical protein IKY12_03790, partial [Clostridia bacterium]|nr:hypothetical protein [Clostridia bacterium]
MIKGKKCARCKAYLLDDEDVVFCPVCGAPHHRECWKDECACADRHGTDEQWTEQEENSADNVNTEDNYQPETDNGDSQIEVCRRCGRINFPAGDKCVYCSAPLPKTHHHNTEHFDPLGNSAPMGNSMPVFMRIDPLGGVFPNEEIDGIKAGEVAAFVTANTHRYIPTFKKMSD